MVAPQPKPFDDVAFLKDTGRWPRWPGCPVKRYRPNEGLPECGLVFDGLKIDEKLAVVMVSMLGWTPEQFRDAKKHLYDSYEEMVADGWLVD